MEENDDADADPANFVPQLILLVILTLINAFFASAEMAVVSANKNKIKRLANEGNKKAKAVEKLCSDETKFLSTIQVGITLAGFFSSATAALTLSGNLAVILEKIHVPYSNQIATVLITIILSYITLIFGELLPKRIALRNPETTAMRFAKILLVIKAIFSPFVKILSANTNFLVKITGIEKGMKDDKISDSDIIDVVKEGIEDGTIEEEKSRMIESTLKFYHLAAKDMMTPRVDTFMIDIDDDQNENLKKILSEKYTRIPVYQNTRDNIIGIINVKDLLNFFYKGNLEKLNFKSILRDAYFVHEYIEANELFEKMKEDKEQMALLIDEFGGFSGIVTMEDLVEEIVGNILDEYDEDEESIIKLSDNKFIINGKLPIHELNQELDLKFDETSSKYDTIAGLIVSKIDKIPTSEENIELDIDNIHLKVLEANKSRIKKVLIEKNKIHEKIA